jgi:phage tail sheath gpL-like
MSSIVLTVTSELTQTHLAQRYQLAGKPKEGAQALSQLFKDLASGNKSGTVLVQTGSASPVAASGTLTLVSAIATDAITIGTTTFTATSTPTLSTDWEIDGASDTLDAASLAAAINAHATVSQIVTATSAANVVTITAKQKGVVGNFIPLSSADATITASGAFLTSGAGGVTEAATTLALGL